jgi:tRNA(fMet)-specific endonuclease VapC
VRLDRATEAYATSIVTVEEIMRGWMAAIRRNQDPYRQINAYSQLERLFRFFSTWNILAWNESAADKFDSLKRGKIRIGTMDLKIACIALANDAILLTRNRSDFEHIPGLRVEDWMS